MKKYVVGLCLFMSMLPISSFASDNEEIIEQGATSYYLSQIPSKELKDFDPLSKILHENLIEGYTRAATKCYFKQLDPKVRCPDYMIGHATMKTGTPRTKICTAAKRAAISPRGCQRKHYTPCTYDNI
ncbi:MAG: hypothetical protein Q8M40_04665 [Legionella sp.]|nr:hypothetical protein [Legionella sp.]